MEYRAHNMPGLGARGSVVEPLRIPVQRCGSAAPSCSTRQALDADRGQEAPPSEQSRLRVTGASPRGPRAHYRLLRTTQAPSRAAGGRCLDEPGDQRRCQLLLVAVGRPPPLLDELPPELFVGDGQRRSGGRPCVDIVGEAMARVPVGSSTPTSGPARPGSRRRYPVGPAQGPPRLPRPIGRRRLQWCASWTPRCA